MSRVPTGIALAVVIVSESVYLTGDLRAPWSGSALIATAAALFALGYVARLRGVLFAAVATAIVAIARFPPWEDQNVPDAAVNCDPSCGSGSVGYLIIVLPVVAVLAAAGLGLATLTGLREQPSRSQESERAR